MKLSDAAVLGDSLRARHGYDYLTKTANGYCGCAIGGGILAAGGTQREDADRFFPWLRYCAATGDNFDYEISCRFFAVIDHDLTFEGLIDYIKSVEPDCGECNRFECSCVKSEAVPVAESVSA